MTVCSGAKLFTVNYSVLHLKVPQQNSSPVVVVVVSDVQADFQRTNRVASQQPYSHLKKSSDSQVDIQLKLFFSSKT